MIEYQFFKLKECLNCFDFNKENKMVFDVKTKEKNNLNLSKINNPIIDEMEKTKDRYKLLFQHLLPLQQLIYLYFHYFLLILIIFI